MRSMNKDRKLSPDEARDEARLEALPIHLVRAIALGTTTLDEAEDQHAPDLDEERWHRAPEPVEAPPFCDRCFGYHSGFDCPDDYND